MAVSVQPATARINGREHNSIMGQRERLIAKPATAVENQPTILAGSVRPATAHHPGEGLHLIMGQPERPIAKPATAVENQPTILMDSVRSAIPLPPGEAHPSTINSRWIMAMQTETAASVIHLVDQITTALPAMIKTR